MKSILVARSPVFAGMFGHDMLEDRENEVTIPDFGSSVIKELLKFIYTGYAGNLKELATELLAAADK